jgi:hypothetical protein
MFENEILKSDFQRWHSPPLARHMLLLLMFQKMAVAATKPPPASRIHSDGRAK